MVHYGDAGAAADDDARFALRGAHALGHDDAEERGKVHAMVKDMPVSAAGENGLDNAGIQYLTAAELTMRHVKTGDQTRVMVPAAAYITAGAWTRWINTLHSMVTRCEPTRTAGTYADWLASVDSAYKTATPEELAHLTLMPADLAPVQMQPPAPAAGAAPGAAGGGAAGATAGDPAAAAAHAVAPAVGHGHERVELAFLGAQTFAELEDERRCLGPFIPWLKAMQGHMGAAIRRTDGFVRTAMVMVTAAAKLEGAAVSELEADELAAAISRLCKQLAIPADTRTMTACCGAALRSELRLELATDKTPTSQAALLSQRFWAAAAYRGVVGAGGGHSRAILAMVGPAHSLPGSEACEMAAEAAWRAGICRADDLFTPTIMRDLEKAIAHLEGVLLGAPWVGRSPRERLEHVVSLLRTDATAWQRNYGAGHLPSAGPSSSHTAAGAGDGPGDGAAEPTGRGVIPRHYQWQVPIAKASDAYRTVRDAAIERLRTGDEDAQLDALQILCTGVVVSSGVAQPRRWSALASLIADGPKRGIVADLVDDVLAPLTIIARSRTAELLGRTV